MTQCKAISKTTNKKCSKSAVLVGYCIAHYKIFEYPENVEVIEYQGMRTRGSEICDICKIEKMGNFYYFIVSIFKWITPFCVCRDCLKKHSQYEDKVRESHGTKQEMPEMQRNCCKIQ